MEELAVIAILSALGHPTRMATFRHLVASEPDGLAAGALAIAVGVPQSTLSAHLAVLSNSGVIRSTRRSRSIIYRAEIGLLRDALLFLVSDCCGGRPEICAALIAELANAKQLPNGFDC